MRIRRLLVFLTYISLAGSDRHEECRAVHSKFHYVQGVRYCAPAFDEYICWPPTKADVVAWEYCPYHKLTVTGRKAYRHCISNGTWYLQNATYQGWTNFTPCFSPEVQLVLEKLHLDHEAKFDVAENTRIMEIVGFSISFIALAVALVIFFSFRSLRNNRTKIHIQLFLATITQVSVRLIVYLDQAIIRSFSDFRGGYNRESAQRGIESNNYVCVSIYVMLEYSINVMFTWMLIEGIYLHYVLTSSALRAPMTYKLFYVIGWGIPMMLTASWVTLNVFYYQNLGSVPLCWFGYNLTPLFWVLQCPRLCVIGANFVFLFIILKDLIMKLRMDNTSEIDKIKKSVRAAIFLLPLLGGANILSMLEPGIETSLLLFKIWSYVTYSLRSFQGFFTALIYCFLNGEVITVLRKAWRDHRAMNQGPFNIGAPGTYLNSILRRGRHSSAARQSADTTTTNLELSRICTVDHQGDNIDSSRTSDNLQAVTSIQGTTKVIIEAIPYEAKKDIDDMINGTINEDTIVIDETTCMPQSKITSESLQQHLSETQYDSIRSHSRMPDLLTLDGFISSEEISPDQPATVGVSPEETTPEKSIHNQEIINSPQEINSDEPAKNNSPDAIITITKPETPPDKVFIPGSFNEIKRTDNDNSSNPNATDKLPSTSYPPSPFNDDLTDNDAPPITTDTNGFVNVSLSDLTDLSDMKNSDSTPASPLASSDNVRKNASFFPNI